MLDQLYRRHHTPALRTLERIIRPAEAAEDALMTAWEILAHRLERQPDYFDESTARAWLVTVARHAHYATTRRYREEAASDRLEHVAASSSDGGIIAHLELAELLQAIEQLNPADQRSQVAALIGLSYRQECACTGATYTNVNRHRTEGRARLRGQLA